MKTTRRGLMAGALAVPTLAGLASWRWQHGEDSVLLHDATLAAGRRFAEAGRAAGGRMLALGRDPIRLAQEVSRERPALIAGLSSYADALLFEEAAAEQGFVRVASINGHPARCLSADCHSGWNSLARLVESAGPAWVEALATYAAKPGRGVEALSPAIAPRHSDRGQVFGWVMTRRA